jgi:hypothetical protein
MRSRACKAAMSLNADRYRRYFEDARQHAARAVNPTEKEAWRRMAARWLRMLALAESPAEASATVPNRRRAERLMRN